MNVPIAYGDPSPIWPLPADERPRYIREARKFGAPRTDKKTGLPRHHAAIDLGSAHGHPVLAPESGTVVALQTFLGPNNYALLLKSDATGIVLLLGELDPRAWQVAAGDHVEKGQWVGAIGTSNMLHFGAFAPGTRQTVQWFVGDPPPAELLDPSDYVERMIAGRAPAPGPDASPARPSEPAAVDGGKGLALLALGLLGAWAIMEGSS